MSTTGKLTIGEMRRAEIMRRRPPGLVVGKIGVCMNGHVYLTTWRRADGQLWCEMCWWKSTEGLALVRDLEVRAKALKESE
jgi:hypothetical protein